MDRDVCRARLIEVLGKIQTDGGFADGGSIEGGTVPLDGLEGFDSNLAPVATRRLCRELDIDIPKEKNIFREAGRSSGRKLTIDEIAKELANARPKTQVAQ
jgi:hypothetical protein